MEIKKITISAQEIPLDKSVFSPGGNLRHYGLRVQPPVDDLAVPGIISRLSTLAQNTEHSAVVTRTGRGDDDSTVFSVYSHRSHSLEAVAKSMATLVNPTMEDNVAVVFVDDAAGF